MHQHAQASIDQTLLTMLANKKVAVPIEELSAHVQTIHTRININVITPITLARVLHLVDQGHVTWDKASRSATATAQGIRWATT